MLFDFPEDFHWQMHGVELVRPTTHFRQDGETFPPVRLFIDRTRINLYLQIFKYHYQSRGKHQKCFNFYILTIKRYGIHLSNLDLLKVAYHSPKFTKLHGVDKKMKTPFSSTL